MRRNCKRTGGNDQSVFHDLPMPLLLMPKTCQHNGKGKKAAKKKGRQKGRNVNNRKCSAFRAEMAADDDNFRHHFASLVVKNKPQDRRENEDRGRGPQKTPAGLEQKQLR